MDHLVPTRPGGSATPDLASIVLADRPEQRPRDTELSAIDARASGFDARSVLVLGIVVAVLAGVIGAATTIGREQPLTTTPVPARERAVQPERIAEPAATPAAPARPVAPAGIDLAPGRLVAARAGDGGGIIRLTVANQGRTALAAEAGGTQVLFLLDGVVMGERTLGSIDATSTATTELGLGTCPSGRHEVAVIVDPRGAVREADERDNATTQSVAFTC